MRAVSFLVIAMLTPACGDEPATSLPDAFVVDAYEGPRVVAIDVLVSQLEIAVYAEAGRRRDVEIPAPGACADLSTDVWGVEPSCIEAMTVNGEPLHAPTPSAMPYLLYSRLATDSVLVIRACGETVEVPVRAGPYATAADVESEIVGEDLVVRWVPPTATTLVGLSGGIGERACNLPGATSHTFSYAASLADIGFGLAHVQPLAEPVLSTSALGPVRVFYGAETIIELER